MREKLYEQKEIWIKCIRTGNQTDIMCKRICTMLNFFLIFKWIYKKLNNFLPEGLSTVTYSSPYDKNNELHDFRWSLCLHLSRSGSDIIISVDVRLQKGTARSLVSFSDRSNRLFCTPRRADRSWDLPRFLSVSAGDSSAVLCGRWVQLATRLHLMLRLSMSVPILYTLHIPSWPSQR